MKVNCIGGGPAGLYFAIQMKKLNPKHEISIFERNPQGSTFGWGVVFSDGTMDRLKNADEESYNQICHALNHWDDIEVSFKGRAIRSSGHGFCGIGRQRLLDILEARAQALGVSLNFEENIDVDNYRDADLVVACDGIFSQTREKYRTIFQPDLDRRKCRYTWLGTKKLYDAFTFLFVERPEGWFQAHCYQFDAETSTFIVECREETWFKVGLDKFDSQQSVAFCEELFSEHLQGARLLSNSAHLRSSAAWINFQRVNCARWHHENIVLLGDAAATAHFSIGSGTKLALESAISLAEEVNREPRLENALVRYEQLRRVEVLKLQNAARNSTEWFETISQRAQLQPEQFVYSLLTRSQRVSHESLRLRDAAYLSSYETWWYQENSGQSPAKLTPPMFAPLRIRALELSNRVVVSPMAMYSAVEGTPTDFYLVHFGSLALGGAGLIFTEMTNVSADARITPGCAGIYTDAQTEAWKRIVDFVHTNSQAKIGMQLGHAGRKGSTRVAWEGMDLPLVSGNWELVAPSALPYTAANATPREMNENDMQRVLADFVAAAKRGVQAGFDMLELHCAHGYLLSSFISPLTNLRNDEYGGSLEGRLKFPIQVFTAIRAVCPVGMPLSVRISATDWVEGGTTPEEAIIIASHFREAGADLIDVSTGQVSPEQKPVYGRMFQTPFADQIRAASGIKTMAVGNIFEPDHVNGILAAGRADLVLLARPHLADPHWTQRAAATLGYADQWWPKQYVSAKRQLETNLKRANQALGAI